MALTIVGVIALIKRQYVMELRSYTPETVKALEYFAGKTGFAGKTDGRLDLPRTCHVCYKGAMIVLGIDPSYTRTGLVWLDNKKLIHTACVSIPQGPRRYGRAGISFYKAIKCGPLPHMAVVEGATSYRNKKTEWMLLELHGIIKWVLDAMDIEIRTPSPSPSQIKKHFTGSGKADKAEVARAIKKAYGISFKDDSGGDLSDACALALYGGWRC